MGLVDADLVGFLRLFGGGGSSQVQALKVGVPCVEFKPFAPQGGAWGCEFSADWGLLWSL